jgi:hypothetical protein
MEVAAAPRYSHYYHFHNNRNKSYPPPMILNQSMYIVSTGNAHIVGEVMNQAPVPIKFVKL